MSQLFKSILACALASLFSSAALFAIDATKISVDVAVDPSIPTVTFSWDNQAAGVSVQVLRRELGKSGTSGDGAFQLIGTVSYPTATYVDTGVSTGQSYEYRIYRPAVGSYYETAAYLAVTVDAPLVDQRGTVLLVVDNTLEYSMAEELALLELDLAGDGWKVRRLDFAQHGVGTHQALKAAIVAARAADPSINALYLFGRLPMARSGLIAPDGHSPSRAHETDLYYADLDGVWTDTVYNVDADGDGGLDEEADNIPGDGKFDQSNIPSAIELMTGRVDFYKMTAHRKNEIEYLRDYIGKSHAWRHALRQVPYRATNGSTGYLFMERSWQNAMFGSNNLSGLEFGASIRTEPYLWAADFPSNDGTAEDVYGAVDNKAIFTICFGSYKQMWFRENNPMRNLLAQPDWGLTCAWGARPAWHMHHMAAGQPVGYSAMRTINNGFTASAANGNKPEYYPPGQYTGLDKYVSVNLMGDPTLRMHPVLPPGSLSASGSGATASLTWSAAADPTRTGFHVYRSTERAGSYERLTAVPLPAGATGFSDTSRPGGDCYYQVRAIATTTVPTGTYTNQSQGIFCLLKADGTANAAPVPTTPRALAAQANVPVLIPFSGTDADGDPLVPILLDNPDHGQIRWHDGVAHYVPGIDYTGADSLTYCLFDGVNLSAPATIDISVVNSGDLLLGWEFGSPSSGNQNPDATYHSPLIASSSITKGSGVSLSTNSGSNNDAYFISGADDTAFNASDYLEWSISPVDGARQSLRNLLFFAAGGAAQVDALPDPYNLELRASTDGFATYTKIPLGPTETPVGLNSIRANSGFLFSADLSGIPSFQQESVPVTFRLYVWNAENFALGKSGDNSAQSSFDLAIFGTALEIAPVAEAGPDATYTDGAYSIGLDGSATTGLNAAYSWAQTAGPPVSLSGADTLSPSFPADVAGTYTFTLTASNAGGTSTDSVTIRVTPGDGAPFTGAGADAVGYLGEAVALSGSSFDPEGTPVTCLWTQIGGPTAVSLTGAGTATASFTPSEPGVYRFRLTGTSNGLSSSAVVNITVTGSRTFLLHEPFDYEVTGDLSGAGSWAETDSDGIDTKLVTGLSLGDYQVTGNAAATQKTESTGRAVTFGKSLKELGTVYASGLFKATAGSWGGSALVAFQLNINAGAASTSGLVLGLSNGNTTASTGSHNAVHAYASLNSLITNNPVARADTAILADNLVAGSTYFLLAKYEVTDAANNLAAVSLLVVGPGETIPTSESGVSWSKTVSGVPIGTNLQGTSPISGFFVGQGNTPGTAGVTNVVDEIRVGGSFEDVLPRTAPAAFVPAPYESWASGIDWGDADSGAGAHVGPLGVSNLMLYALDIGDPLTRNTSLLPQLGPMLEEGGNRYLSFDFRENTRASDLATGVLSSESLEEGSWSTLIPDGTSVVREILDADPDGDGSARLVRYKILLDPDADRRFFRLETRRQ